MRPSRAVTAWTVSRELRADGPVLEHDLAHREISRIAGREPAAKREGGRGHEAVRLRKRAPAPGELAPPFTCLPALGTSQRHDSKAGKERASRFVLARFASWYAIRLRTIRDVSGNRA